MTDRSGPPLVALWIHRHVFASPSPEGRGCRAAAGEGYKNEKALSKYVLSPSPGPLSRATLTLRERDLPECISHFGRQSFPN